MADLTTELNATRSAVDEMAGSLGAEMKATRNLVTQSTITAPIVRDGIDASIDIDAIKAELGYIKTALGGTKQFQREWVEDPAGAIFLRIGSLSVSGISDAYLGLNGLPATPSGPVRPIQPGRLSGPALSFSDSATDTEIQKRIARLQFPGGITPVFADITAAGLTTLTNIPTGSRIVITKYLLQSSGTTLVSAVVKSVGATNSSIIKYRLSGDGSGVDNVLSHQTYLKLSLNSNIAVDLSVAANVYAHFLYYLENPVTGLPLTQ